MSIYFQFPAIEEYPNLTSPLKTVQNDKSLTRDEDLIKAEQLSELKDFLALKPV